MLSMPGTLLSDCLVMDSFYQMTQLLAARPKSMGRTCSILEQIALMQFQGFGKLGAYSKGTTHV
jgi:hypothetical protein